MGAKRAYSIQRAYSRVKKAAHHVLPLTSILKGFESYDFKAFLHKLQDHKGEHDEDDLVSKLVHYSRRYSDEETIRPRLDSLRYSLAPKARSLMEEHFGAHDVLMGIMYDMMYVTFTARGVHEICTGSEDSVPWAVVTAAALIVKVVGNRYLSTRLERRENYFADELIKDLSDEGHPQLRPHA